MIRRRALAAGLLAAGLAFIGSSWLSPTRSAWVLRRSLPAGAVLGPSSLVLEDLSVAGVPDGAWPADPSPMGMEARRSLEAGTVLTRALLKPVAHVTWVEGQPLSGDLRAVGLAVTPAGLVGGLVAPGDRVDVLATAASGAASSGPWSEVLVRGVTVLAVRTAEGGSLTPSGGFYGGMPPRPGLAVVALPAGDVARVLALGSQGSYALALDPSR